MAAPRASVLFSVFIAALGYFVDLYDIAVFAVVRVASLEELGLTGVANTQWGIHLFNLQMVGLLIGGLGWGVVGDKLGRRTALIATIACYSLANIANAFITNVEQYAVLRLVAGIGLAGELGAGVALVAEVLPKHRRGYGIVIITLLGIAGSLAAAYVGGHFHWRLAYLAGGSAGLLVLAGRIIGLRESALFESSRDAPGARGDLRLLFSTRSVLLRLLAVIAVGVPIWFVSSLLVSFAPEYGKALGFAEPIQVATVAIWQAFGLGLGNLLAGTLSERLRSRKRVLWACLGAIPPACVALLLQESPAAYAYVTLLLGMAQGYWSVYLTMGAEQFGTNVRAMVTVSVPNFVRVSTVPILLAMGALSPLLGWIPATAVVGAVVFGLAFAGLWSLRETYDKDLDFTEVSSRA